ncbi:MAG: TolC family protein [Gammaproteobacteria bacterium]|nr:TolC family protein [Gammaproteobacteria bacterium]
MPFNQSKSLAALVLLPALLGCGASEVTTRAHSPDMPAAWPSEVDTSDVEDGWLGSLQDDELATLVDEALAQNHALARIKEDIAQAEAALASTSAARLPAVSASFDASKSDHGTGASSSGFAQPSGVRERFGASLGVNWEIDVLLKLADGARRASLDYLAQQSAYEWAQLGLVSDVASAYFSHREASELLRLSQKRLDNLATNLEIVERGYRQGINNAVDVYLSRSVLAQQQAQVAERQAAQVARAIRLQRLLGRVPDGDIAPGADLEVLTTPVAVGLPSTLLKRRHDVREAWLNLLAADAAVAVAHKNRFPRITLAASTSDTTSEIDALLSEGSLAWSVAGGLTAPIFDAGRLKALEEAARSRTRATERLYMERVAVAFGEVHQAITDQAALRRRHDAYASSADNAHAAAGLSFEQYQRGLTTYVTVLESERRAFDAQTTLVRLRAELLRNRVALHRALGGDWQTAGSPADS